ncbi:MAG TPA: hypothetical protein VHG92_11425 [Afifellaceae bacterium]|nr:hypothetical protein [Afifellaceae bacterium]
MEQVIPKWLVWGLAGIGLLTASYLFGKLTGTLSREAEQQGKRIDLLLLVVVTASLFLSFFAVFRESNRLDAIERRLERIEVISPSQ